jgi:hypothetical protein
MFVSPLPVHFPTRSSSVISCGWVILVPDGVEDGDVAEVPEPAHEHDENAPAAVQTCAPDPPDGHAQATLAPSTHFGLWLPQPATITHDNANITMS